MHLDCDFSTKYSRENKKKNKIYFRCKKYGKNLCFSCTDEISISDVNRHKTYLAIIYMCLKMYCYKCTF